MIEQYQDPNVTEKLLQLEKNLADLSEGQRTLQNQIVGLLNYVSNTSNKGERGQNPKRKEKKQTNPN